VFKNRVLRETFGSKRKKQEAAEKCIMRSFMAFLWSPNIMWVISLGSHNLGMLQEMGEEKCIQAFDGVEGGNK
jgi:hypothetical protein